MQKQNDSLYQKNTKCIQELYSPKSACFGCGPANEKGLKIRSFPVKTADRIEVHADFKAEAHHEAFPGMVNGGIIGALLDCHSNWTAAYLLMRQELMTLVPAEPKLQLSEEAKSLLPEDAKPPCTVTADFHVKLKRPTPSSEVLTLKAWAEEIHADRVLVYAELLAAGKVCATCRGTFVAVKEGHPAYHRW